MADPPEHVTFAAHVVNSWLSKQPGQPGQTKVDDATFAKMDAASRIEYCRRFDQKQFYGANPNDRRTTK